MVVLDCLLLELELELEALSEDWLDEDELLLDPPETTVWDADCWL